tara:strand:+ start:2137 stop:3048 length:912 start_codon:yes stop_codon:yes gene_type:complete
MKTILITGGTGLIGRYLIKSLSKDSNTIYVLTRSESRFENNVNFINWDPDSQRLDLSNIPAVDYIINLAGASIDGSRWTNSYKRKILESRLNSTSLLFKEIKKLKQKPSLYIGASATGIYKKNTKVAQVEKDHKGSDFLSDVVTKWEKESNNFMKYGIRTVLLRIGLVLSKDGGVLKKLYPIFKLFLGVPIGSGRQTISWIHIKDLVGFIHKSISDNKISGAYNLTAPEVITNYKFTEELASVWKRPVFPKIFKAPSLIVKLLFGEQSSLVLNGLNVSSNKIESTSFKFSFTNIKSALKDIYR